MRLILILALALGASGPLWAQHGQHAGRSGGGRDDWTAQPLLLLERADDRAWATLRIRGSQAPSVLVFGPAGGQREFQVADGRARIQVPDAGVGNYQWVQAREEQEGHVAVASTVWLSGPRGPSPRVLLETRHGELEIVPAPLPREHANYRESEKWPFMVRYQGQPLAGQRLLLETQNGSRSTFVTDAQGVATVLFPRDFNDQPGRSGHGARLTAGFVLSTEYLGDGRHFVTAFNAGYGQDADRQRSLGWGAAFGALGMLSALPLLRRRKPGPKGSADKEPSC